MYFINKLLIMKQIEDPKVAYRTFLSGQVARIPYYKEANNHL